MSQEPPKSCPICTLDSGVKTHIVRIVQRLGGDNRQLCGPMDTVWLITCPYCGGFVIDRDEVEDHLKSPHREKFEPNKLSALLRERYLRHKTYTWIYFGEHAPDLSWWALPVGTTKVRFAELRHLWPSRVAEKLDRFLLNLSHKSEFPGFEFRLAEEDSSIAFAAERKELFFLIESLAEQELVRIIGDRVCPYLATISAKGWERIHELSRTSGSPLNPVFVAMWFGKEGRASRATMENLFIQAIEPALNQAGYKAKRADTEPTDDYIMNQIIGDIRQAPFVVADFTRHRRGVYFEAGFARGLAKPVINTCSKQDFNRAHFDTKQLPHILWDDDEGLLRELREWIRAFVGQGPYKWPEDFLVSMASKNNKTKER